MDEKSDRAMRYDNYCCLVFNTIERIWKHCKGNENRIEEFLSSKEMINRHKAWWRSEKENNAGYGYAFAEFVNSFLKP